METKKPLRLPTAHIPPYGLRLQPELKAQLEAAASQAGRSLNAEITARLEQTFQSKATLDAPVDLHVVIDSSGYPISWREISEHLNCILSSSELPVVNITTSVLTPELAPGQSSPEHLSKIRSSYKRLSHKR
jgi:hypothetical protein